MTADRSMVAGKQEGEKPELDPGPILEVDHLIMNYRTKDGYVSAVQDVSFTIGRGESLGLVGESGCGKTSIAMSLVRLLPDNAEIQAGKIVLDEDNLLELSDGEMQRRRWNDIAMIFQGAMN